jgi:hypothetical protein
MDILPIDILPMDILQIDILPMLHINKWLTTNVMITSASLDKHYLKTTFLSSCSYTTATSLGRNLRIAPVRFLPAVIITQIWFSVCKKFNL